MFTFLDVHPRPEALLYGLMRLQDKIDQMTIVKGESSFRPANH